MERMFQSPNPSSPWRKLERKLAGEHESDFVEIGACTHCGRGVDRDFPAEYRFVEDQLVCAECVPLTPHLYASGASDAVPVFPTTDSGGSGGKPAKRRSVR